MKVNEIREMSAGELNQKLASLKEEANPDADKILVNSILGAQVLKISISSGISFF